MRSPALLPVLLLATALPVAGQEPGGRMAATVPVPSGTYQPLYATDSAATRVEGFRLDSLPVTAADFLAFVREEPEWRRDEAPPLFVGEGYLASWENPLETGEARGPRTRPVTGVSWFAARAYCASRGGRLPTTHEWEYAASFPEEGWTGTRSELHARLLDLHGHRPRAQALPSVGHVHRNRLGVWDLHGLVWEWTDDFNNEMITGAGRDDRGLDRQLFCAAGSVGVPDPSDYVAFLRASIRASLDGAEGGLLLGFRCAYDTP